MNTVSVIGSSSPEPTLPSFKGPLGSCNNINIQGQINTGNNILGQVSEHIGDNNKSNQIAIQDQSSNQQSQCVH